MKIYSSDTTTLSQHVPVCPYCKLEEEQDFDKHTLIRHGEQPTMDLTCRGCEKVYTVEVEVTVAFSSYKK